MAERNIFFRIVLRGILLFIFAGIWCVGNTIASETKDGNVKKGATTVSSEYIIGLGDQLQIMVWNEAELSQEMAVRIDGRISLPLLGDVVAAGRTISELGTSLEKLFSEVVTEPSVTVMLRESKSWRYYIIGQISRPGEFPIEYPINVLQAIARSGGFLEWAKKDTISIFRQESGQETILKFNYESLVEGKDLFQNVMIKPGDTIIIP